MPNWCLNNVIFKGGKLELNCVRTIFNYLQIKEKETEQGQNLLFNDSKEYMFNISNYMVEDELRVQFDTKWTPVFNDLIQLARCLNVEFLLYYQELGNGIYGQLKYDLKAGVKERTLSPDEIEIITCDDNGNYIYQGEIIYDDEVDDIYDKILEEKEWQYLK